MNCTICVTLTDETEFGDYDGLVQFPVPNCLTNGEIKDYVEMLAMLAYNAAEQKRNDVNAAMKKEAGNE